MSVRVRELVFVFAGFFVAALVLTWPLWIHPTRTLPSDLIDTLLNTWILGWDADRLRHGLVGVWDAPIFYPHGNTLAFSENLLGLAVFVAPVYWVTANAVLTYNVAFVLSIAIAGTGMYLLAYALTASRPAALVGAAAYAFCQYRFAQIMHIQMVATGWMPVALFGLHQYFATLRARWLVAFAIAVLLQVTSNAYALYFLLVPAGIVAVEGLFRERNARWRAMRDVAAGAILTLVLLAPVIYQYARARADYGQIRNAKEIEMGSADVRSYLVLRNFIGIWRWLPTAAWNDPERELFPGVVVVALAAVAVRHALRRRDERARWVAVYGIVVVAAAAISFGPIVHAWDRSILRHAPYEWLHRVVPGWNGMRVPARFAIVAFLGLSALAAIGARALLDRVPARRRSLATSCLIALILAEGWPMPLPLVAYDARGRPVDRAVAEWLRQSPPGAVLHLPFETEDFVELNYQYATLIHHHPVMNGMSGYNSPMQMLSRNIDGPFHDFDRYAAFVRMLRSMGVRYVVINFADYGRAQIARDEHRRALNGLRASGQIAREQIVLGAYLFELSPWTAPSAPSAADLSTPIHDMKLSAAQSDDRVPLLVDGDRDTRWFGDQDGDSWIEAAFPREYDVATVELQLAERSLIDYPRELRIDSTDAAGAIRTLYHDAPYPEFAAAFIHDPKYPRLLLHLPRNASMTLTIRASANVPRRWWSVHELRLWQRR